MDEVIGTAIFLIAKFFGYALYFAVLGRRLGATRSAFVLSAARVLLGLALGGLVWLTLAKAIHAELVVYISAILFARLLVWTAVVEWGFANATTKARLAAIVGGTVISYLIDIPVFFGVIVAIGGIC